MKRLSFVRKDYRLKVVSRIVSVGLALVLLSCTVAAVVFLFWLQGFLAALLLGLAFGVKCANIWALSALMVFLAGGVLVYVSR